MKLVQQRISLILIGMIGVLLTLGIGVHSAQAQPTQAMQDVINAIDPASNTLPDTFGEVQARFTNSAGDTFWQPATGTVTATVDTGYDLSDTAAGLDPANAGSDTQNLTAGDSVVVAIPIQNLGNNASAVNFDAYNLIGGTATSNDTWTVELFHAADTLAATAFDTSAIGGTITRVAGSDGQVPFTYRETKTFFAVITAKANARNGETETTEFFVTNNAPTASGQTNGDGWTAASGPINDEGGNDTQSFTITSSISGPVLSVSKTQTVVSSDTRPGGQIDYTITVQNTGSDTAYNVDIVDAIPEFASYKVGTAGAVADTPTITYENTLTSNAFDDTEDTGNAKIKWTYGAISDADDGDTTRQVTFSVLID